MLTFLWHSTVSVGLVVLQPSLMMHTSVWASIREPRGQSMVLKGPGVPSGALFSCLATRKGG